MKLERYDNGTVKLVNAEGKEIVIYEDMVKINDKEVKFNKDVVESYKSIVNDLLKDYREKFIKIMENPKCIEKIETGYQELILKINENNIKVLYEWYCSEEGWHDRDFECQNCEYCTSHKVITSVFLNGVEIYFIELDGDYENDEEREKSELLKAVNKLDDILMKVNWL